MIFLFYLWYKRIISFDFDLYYYFTLLVIKSIGTEKHKTIQNLVGT